MVKRGTIHVDKDFVQYDGQNMGRAVTRWKQFMTVNNLRHFNKEETTSDLQVFAEFIGYPYPQPDIKRLPYQKIVNTYDPRIRDIIDKINSEHGETVLKILKVKWDGRKSR